jgi:hypothetical protein
MGGARLESKGQRRATIGMMWQANLLYMVADRRTRQPEADRGRQMFTADKDAGSK